MDEDTPELINAIYRNKVLRARKQSITERFEDGIALFESAVGMMKSGIRHQFPDSSDDEIETILRQRLQRLRQVDEHGLYKTAEDQAV